LVNVSITTANADIMPMAQNVPPVNGLKQRRILNTGLFPSLLLLLLSSHINGHLVGIAFVHHLICRPTLAAKVRASKLLAVYIIYDVNVALEDLETVVKW
jgi:hypothetical protein